MLEKYKAVRARTEALCEPLKIEDYIPQPVDFASPPKWHLAHTTWFFEEMILAKYDAQYQRFHPDFAYLFNSYYNTIGERTLRADRGNISRPTVMEVYAYRVHVDHAMGTLLEVEKDNLALLELVELGLNHEQQHQELLITDLKYTLGHNPLFPVYKPDFDLTRQSDQKTDFISINEGIYEIGHNDNAFAFDNEKNRHKTYIQNFSIKNALVTNGEFMEFMADGGYNTFNLWLDEGWSWVKSADVKSPLYWHFIDGKWFIYTLSGLREVNPNELLCHISYYEAMAFATWKSMRLPTEFEWEVASNQIEWGSRWEWTNSAYLAYPGFKVASGAVGEYNGKFMINQMVLRGASSATAKHHSRSTYRNFFHPQMQWQFSGIRLVK